MRACCVVVPVRGYSPRPGSPPCVGARVSRPLSRPKGQVLTHATPLASIGESSTAPIFSLASVAMSQSQTAGMPTETVGILAAAATPLLGAIGLFIWNKIWRADAFTLNLVKCFVGTVGFVIAGVGSTGAQWLVNANAKVTGWLILSSFIGIVVGDNLWLYSLQQLGARRVILIDILKPFIALGLARAALNEGVSVSVVVGMIITLAGVLVVSLEEREEREDTGDRKGGEDANMQPEYLERESALEIDMDDRDCATLADVDVAESAKIEAVAKKATRATVAGYVAASLNVAFDTWGTVLTKQYGGALNTWEINFIRFGTAAAALLLGAVVRDVWRRGKSESSGGKDDTGVTGVTRHQHTSNPYKPPNSTLPLGIPHLSPRAWVQILTGIIFTTFLAPGLGNFALFRVSSLAVFSTLMCIGPIYALPLGRVISQEKITWRAVVGSVVAVGGTLPMFFGQKWGLP